MRTLAVTGGIGSGKSYVVRMFAALGVPVYDADARTKELYASDPGLLSELKTLIGDAVVRDGVLDRQYMLGDSLLVAPVFRADGEVTYYVPEGRWTNYLTGEVKEGGRWYKETFDYFHLPLLVRENTILPVGETEDRPDYDYQTGTVLKIYQPVDRVPAEISIPDMKGENPVHVRMCSTDGQVSVTADGGNNLTAVCMAEQGMDLKVPVAVL